VLSKIAQCVEYFGIREWSQGVGMRRDAEPGSDPTRARLRDGIVTSVGAAESRSALRTGTDCKARAMSVTRFFTVPGRERAIVGCCSFRMQTARRWPRLCGRRGLAVGSGQPRSGLRASLPADCREVRPSRARHLCRLCGNAAPVRLRAIGLQQVATLALQRNADS